MGQAEFMGVVPWLEKQGRDVPAAARADRFLVLRWVF